MPFQFVLDFCIGYVLIELEAKYCYNATSYKYVINKVYDLVGQLSYVCVYVINKVYDSVGQLSYVCVYVINKVYDCVGLLSYVWVYVINKVYDLVGHLMKVSIQTLSCIYLHLNISKCWRLYVHDDV